MRIDGTRLFNLYSENLNHGKSESTLLNSKPSRTISSITGCLTQVWKRLSDLTN